MNVLVTGASGFIASHLMPSLLSRGWRVRGTVRHPDRLPRLPAHVEGVTVGDLGPETDWSAALGGIDVIVHLAARVHVMHDVESEVYARANVGGSCHLAEAAAAAGVKRLVFMSSVKAMGEGTASGHSWTEEEPCCPQDPYGQSKWAAELALREVATRTGMEVVVLRPPVVYGPGVVANVYNLLRVIDRGWPLPLGLVKNRRSFVYVCNLVDAMVKAMEHPDAAGETFLVSDGEDLSTPEFIRAIARALDKPARLLPVPLTLLWLAGRMLGKAAEVDRLLGSLVVDNAKIRGVLGWQPRCTMAEGLAHTVQWYLKCQAALTH